MEIGKSLLVLREKGAENMRTDELVKTLLYEYTVYERATNLFVIYVVEI